VRIAEKITPVLAATSAVATLACCVPIGATFLGLGGLLALAGSYQQWLLPLSGLLLGIGSLQLWHSRRVCRRTSKWSVAILAASAAIVAFVAFFPQTIANLLTDWLS
jgi:hypothetical protein